MCAAMLQSIHFIAPLKFACFLSTFHTNDETLCRIFLEIFVFSKKCNTSICLHHNGKTTCVRLHF